MKLSRPPITAYSEKKRVIFPPEKFLALLGNYRTDRPSNRLTDRRAQGHFTFYSFKIPRTHVFCKLLLNGAWYDGKVGCIQFLGIKNINFHFLLCTHPLMWIPYTGNLYMVRDSIPSKHFSPD